MTLLRLARVRHIGSLLHAAALFCVVISSTALATDIEQSPNDDREYRHIRLANGLKVTLIHDSNADMAAAAMDVAVGAGSDPEERPGLAHFLEHMLFLGTEKYPEPNEYAAFIQQHGGSNNAYTTFGNTNYFFEIEASQLEMALDRFAQFFIAPLFSEDLVQREKNAVHSEFTGKRREEGLRFWSVRKEGFNPAHPITGFTTGTLDTLADRPGSNIREELIAFYHAHYSSNIMSLAIAGRDSLDQMEAWARDKFSSIENRRAKPQQFDIDLFTEKQLTTRLDARPLTDQRFLVMTFPVTKEPRYQFSRPRAYIGNVLGHEGPGSLLSELKRQGWVNALSAGGSTATRQAASFDISIGLTDNGTKHINEVVEAVFAAINRLRESGLPRWMFDENQMIDELSFRYQEKSAAASMVRSLSVRAQEWPAEKLLSGPYRRSHFDTEGITSMLSQLTPDNMQLLVVTPDVSTDRTTPWYDAPFRRYPISGQALEQWRSAGLNDRIKMPQPNQFVPEDLTLRADGQGDPLKLIDTPKLQVWHRTDASFGVPRANLRANIHLPLAVESAQNNVMTEIYSRMVNEQLSEFSYAANLAGLGAGISPNSRGLSMTMGGYADGQLQMLNNVVQAMTNVIRDETLFARLTRELREEITNVTQDAPYKQTAARTYQLLYTPYYTDKQRLAALESINIDQLIEFAGKLFTEVKIVVLSHGNLTATETLQRIELLQHSLLNNASAAHVERIHMVRLEPQSRYVDELKLDHADSSISIYLQSDKRDRATRAQFALLRQLLSQPLYTELRTRQQLGYFVFTYSIDLIQVPSVVIALQSPEASPVALYHAVEKFLLDFEQQLLSLDDAEFQRNVQAVVSQVEEQDKRLRHRTNRYWGAITREDYQFDASALFANALKSVTKQQMIDLYQQMFVTQKNGRLVVYSAGNSTESDNPDDLDNPELNDSLQDPFSAMQSVVSIADFKANKILLPPLSDVAGVE